MDKEDLKLLPRHELQDRVLQILEGPGNRQLSTRKADIKKAKSGLTKAAWFVDRLEGHDCREAGCEGGLRSRAAEFRDRWWARSVQSMLD